jgi:hypothetical protein
MEKSLFIMTPKEVDVRLNTIIEEMQSAGEIIDDLHRLGYLYNFDLVGNKLICLQTHIQ